MAVAVCSGAVHLLLVPCVYAGVVVVGSDGGTDDGATHCAWLAVFTVSLFFFHFSLSITHEGKQALNATVKFKGSERTNSTHTQRPHTYIYMFSRVAAAEAPRTHNRRRVTGSSGRRREGRESERQRPNMSRHLFYSAFLLLLLVVVMSCVTGAVTADGKETTEPKFEWKDAKSDDVTVESLCVPGLLKVANDVFVVAEAQCKENGQEGNTFTGIASQLLKTEDSNTPVDVLGDAKSKTQVLEENNSANAKKMDVSRPTTVTRGSEVYMLVGRYSGKPGASVQDNGADDSGLLLVKGDVSGDEESNKKIDWKSNTALPRTTFGEEYNSLTGLVGGGGSGIETEDGKLVFPVEGTKKGNTETDVKIVSLIISSLKDTNSWTLSNE
ncbi:trans-sialidase, putative, partial [Trypanosoma cruzi marinkellei]